MNKSIIKTKAKSIPHPQVGGGTYPGTQYNVASEKGKDITFLPHRHRPAKGK